MTVASKWGVILAYKGNLLSMYVVFGHENLITIWPGGIGERNIFLKSGAIRN